MKKFFAMIFAAVMVFAMVGCSASVNTDKIDLNQPGAGTTAAPTAGETSEPTIPASLPEVPPLEDPTEPTETEPAATQGAETPSLGTVDGNTYVNEYIGMEFVGPVNFEYASYEDILLLNGLTVDATTIDLETKLVSGGLCFMVAESESALASVTGLKLTTDQINTLDIQSDLEATVETVEATYLADGYVDVDVNYAELTIGDTRADALIITAELLGQDFYGAMVRYLHNDLYITVIAGATNQADVETMLQNSSIY